MNLLQKTIETADDLAQILEIDRVEAFKLVLAYEQNRIIEAQLQRLNKNFEDGIKKIIDTHQSILFN